MPGEFNYDYRGNQEAPAVFGAVTANTNFTFGGRTYVARAILAGADGTIDVIAEDGTAVTGKLMFKGLNVFRCIRVTNTGGLTLEWQA